MKSLYQHQQTVTTATPTGPVTLTVQHSYEHSAPMLYGDRVDAYYVQNGGHLLTVCQERAVRKAHKRSIARAAVQLAGAR